MNTPLPAFSFGRAWSIRTLLMLLVFIAVLPALGIIFYSGLEEQKQDAEDAKMRILQTVESLANYQEIITASTKQTLLTLSQLPEVQNGDTRACDRLFRDLLQVSPFLNTMIAVATDGTALAAGVPLGSPFNVADRRYFQQTMATRDFSVGEFIVAKSTHDPILPFAYPVTNSQGQITGAVITGFKLEQYERFLSQSLLPEGSIVGIEDRKGVRLCRYPKIDGSDSEALGKTISTTVWNHISGPRRKGTYVDTGLDGVRRIYGFIQIRLREGEAPYLYMRVGIPEKSALANATYHLYRNAGFLFLAASLALVAACVLGNLTITNRLRRLVRLSQRLGAGDFHERSGLSHLQGGEIGSLADAFDSMASDLEKREIERQHREQEIRRLHHKNQLILNTADEGIVGLDNQGLVVFINLSAAAMTGYEAHELLGQDLHSRIHHTRSDGSAYPPDLCPMHKTLEQGTANRVRDEVLWRKDGTSFPAAYSSTPIIKNGSVSGAVVTFRDITQRARMEEKLRKREQDFRALAENSPGVMHSLVLRTDGSFYMPYISHRIEELNGLRPSDMSVDMSASNARIHPDDIDKVADSIAESARNLSPLHVEFRWRHPAKGDVWVEGRSTPQRQADGSILWSGFFHDISRHKELEKELFIARKLEIIGQLAGGVAHEVRNPLNAILSITEALFTEQGIAGNPDFQPYVEHIRAQVNRLSKLMNDLLSLGKQIKPSSIQSLSLTQVCADTVRLWQSTRTELDHPITLVCDADHEDPLVRADGMHLQQALLNLLENAAKSSRAGSGISLRITQTGHSKACVEIRDAGTGIPAQKIERIFEPFFTLTKGGTGLGLTLVKHYIESMGGEIRIRNNEPPPGCTAELILNTARRRP